MEYMIDIETLDTRPTAVVLQVGIVGFEVTYGKEGVMVNIDTEHKWNLPVLPQLLMGRTIGEDTLEWWRGQPTEAQASVMAPSAGHAMEDYMQRICNVLHGEPYEEGREGPPLEAVWAKGPQFDLGTLENLMEQCEVDVPWRYSQARDLRTTIKLAERKWQSNPMPSSGGLEWAVAGGWRPERDKRKELAHDAVGDCRYQIRELAAALNVLHGGWGE